VEILNKATRIALSDFKTPHMRAFHMTWLAFFLCFFGWFGVAPLMAVVRDELQLTKAQVGNTIIASVAITILVRMIVGPLCDRYGPRRVYSGLSILGSLPVMGVGLAYNYETFLLFRLAIGAIGASFVITQYHTSIMFAPNVVGTANATAAGWGNLGGGVTQMVMPLVFLGITSLGVSSFWGWRLAMVIPGAALFLVGVAYYFLTQDAPNGNYEDLRARGEMPPLRSEKGGSLRAAARDPRVWALFVVYAACFGMEITIDNVAALYFHDRFHLDIRTAGLIAGLFGFMNIFARALGGIFSDRIAAWKGLMGRVRFLGAVLFLEGVSLLVFSWMSHLPLAVAAMMMMGLFVKMANGATYAVVPFINKKALGAVAGIVAAGGNAGAAAAGFLFRAEGLSMQDALFYLGVAVTACSLATLVVQFSPEALAEERRAFESALAGRFRGISPTA
jgi:NNP family nitrate/nitrite transporter-like MFS transporter